MSDPDFARPLVCPDTDHEQYANAIDAAKFLRQRGWQDADAQGVVRAVYHGTEYCGRYWDWRGPVTAAVK